MMSKPAKLHDDDARQAIINDIDSTILVEASAGTGKTTSMVQRMCQLVRSGAKMDSIVAITFTRKAAAELRGRFFAQMQKLAHDPESNQSEKQIFLKAILQIDRCFIGTIHSACGKFLSEKPIEAGLSLNFKEIEDVQDAALRSQAWSIFVAESLADSNNTYLQQMEELSLSFNNLKNSFERFSQYADVTNWPQEHVEAPTMENLSEAISKLYSYSETMQQMQPQLSDGSDKLITDIYKKLPQQLQNISLQIPAEVAELFERFKPEYKKTLKCWPDKETANDQHEKWRNFYNNVIYPVVKIFQARRYSLAMNIFHDAQNIYDNLRSSANSVNFQDLLLKFRDLLKNNHQQRQYFQSQISHLLVDEFQDTDPVQAEIMMLLSADDSQCCDWRKCRPAAGKLFVVGDPKQSIYRFRRADIQTYNFVRRRIIESGGKVLSLNVNFRSGKKVINWINNLFSTVFPESATDYQAAADNMHAGRDVQAADEKPDIEGIYVSQLEAKGNRNADALAEDAEKIAGFIHNVLAEGKTIIDFDKTGKALTRAVHPGDFMIITSKTKQLGSYGSALQARGIPVEITGGGQLSQNEKLYGLYTLLSAACHHDDPVALVSYLRGDLEGFSDDELLAFKRCGGKFDYCLPLPDGLTDNLRTRISHAYQRLDNCFKTLSNTLPLRAAVEKILTDHGLWLGAGCEAEAGELHLGSLLKLTELCSMPEIADTPEALITLLEDIIAGKQKYDCTSIYPAGASAVRIMNLHKSKGLEAPVVILAYPRGKSKADPDLHVERSDDTRGYMAINDSGFIEGVQGRLLGCPTNWQDACETEKEFLTTEYARLMYVAATRAGRALIISTNDKRLATDPWNTFHEALENTADIDSFLNDANLPKWQAQRDTDTFSSEQISRAIECIPVKKAELLRKSYNIEAVKEASLTKNLPDLQYQNSDGLGANWGSALHKMLELLLKNPTTNITAAAEKCCELYEMDHSIAGALADAAKSVTMHKLWQRAVSAKRFLSEVPFEMLSDAMDQGKIPTIIRGVIDLAFETPDGWVIADFKTDSAAADSESAQKLAEHYKPQLQSYCNYWQKITGQKIAESGILFTASGEFYKIPVL